jgi:TraK protein.
MIHSRKNSPRRFCSLLGATLLGLGVSWQAHALQLVSVSDGATAYAKLSSDDITRISIADARITSWYAPKGKLVIEKDTKSGQLYVRPIDRGSVVSMFVTSSNGATYALTLQSVDMPSESIVLREEGIKKAPSSIERGSTLESTIKQMMLTMATDRIPIDMEVHESGKVFRLWQGSTLTLVRSWLGQTIMGERFDLTNTGSRPLRLVEQEFFKPGVLAVSVEALNLEPGETTRLFVVRYREGDQ